MAASPRTSSVLDRVPAARAATERPVLAGDERLALGAGGRRGDRECEAVETAPAPPILGENDDRAPAEQAVREPLVEGLETATVRKRKHRAAPRDARYITPRATLRITGTFFRRERWFTALASVLSG